MKIYFIVCAVMMFISFLQVVAKIQEFKQKYPFAKFKKRTVTQSLVNWIHTIFYFLCPIVNLVLFLGINFFFTEELWDKALKECAESY